MNQQDVSELLDDFLEVVRISHANIRRQNLEVDYNNAPHKPPKGLPSEKMAIYIFEYAGRILKVGKVGAKSSARYTSQHYNVNGAMSSLARSLSEDLLFREEENILEENISDWIKENTTRVNFIMDDRCGIHALSLLESFLHCRLKPRYEGYKGQNN